MPYDQAPLPASAPELKGHIIVHPFSRPRPANSWPSTLESIAPIASELSSRAKSGGSLEGFGVSFADGELSYPGAPRTDPGALAAYPDWDAHRNKLLRPLPGDVGENEEFVLHVYTPGKMATVGPVSLRTLDEGAPLADRVSNALGAAPVQTARAKAGDTAHIYVCAHGMRDCRCGVVGGTLIDTLRRTFYEENLRAGGSMKDTRVYAVSHIGGHKWAANAIIYPHGDWYGNLRPLDAGLLLRAAQAPATARYDLNDDREKMVHWPRWRGRLGESQKDMQKLYDIWGPPLTLAANLTPARRVKRAQDPAPAQLRPTPKSVPEPGPEPAPAPAPDSSAAPEAGPQSSALGSGSGPAGSGGASASAAAAAGSSSSSSSGEGVTLRFRSFDGEWFDVPAQIGDNVMKVAKAAGLPSIEATCGGQLECATCHAYVAAPADPADPLGDSDLDEPAPEDVLPPPAEAEDDMLDYAMSREPASRLTCQLTVTPALVAWIGKGGRIQLPRF